MIDAILDIVNKFIPDKDEAMKLAREMEGEVTKRMEMKSDIIKAELANGSGVWRVRLMYICMGIVSCHFFMYDIIPYIRTVFNLDFFVPQAPSSTELWTFLKVGVGGYIGSRGVEKTMAHFKGR
jgi:hypothetical protein